MKRATALVTAAVIGFGAPVSPVFAAPTTPHTAHVSVSIPTAKVSYPQAVPGRFCKKVHRGDWTQTKKYGKVKCIDKNGWRWVRAR